MKIKQIKKFALDLASFGSPQAIIIDLILILLVLSLVPTEKISYLPIKSVFKDFLLPIIFKGNCPETGIFVNCSVYSTGLTHALSRLLHRDIIGAYNFNKLVFPLFFAIIAIIVANIFKIYRKKN